MALIEVDRGVVAPVDKVDEGGYSTLPEEDPARDVHFADHPAVEVVCGDE